MSRARLAVLASGGGSNLGAILAHAETLGEQRAFDVVLVASDRPDSGALERGRAAGLAAHALEGRHAPDGAPMAELLARHEVTHLALAGYLRLVPSDVTHRFAGRVVNVHPAPLPRFGGAGMYGARVHRAVLESGSAWSGPTVHFVDEEYDHGAPIAQWPVPVLPGDDDARLGARVLRAEHLLFPRIVQALAEGRLGARAVIPTSILPAFNPELDEPTLAARLDDAILHALGA